jgi:hypothetical protein
VLGNFLTVGDAVFDMETEGILDVCNGFFVGVPLAVTSLQRGTGNEVTVGITLPEGGRDEAIKTATERTFPPSGFFLWLA